MSSLFGDSAPKWLILCGKMRNPQAIDNEYAKMGLYKRRIFACFRRLTQTLANDGDNGVGIDCGNVGGNTQICVPTATLDDLFLVKMHFLKVPPAEFRHKEPHILSLFD